MGICFEDIREKVTFDNGIEPFFSWGDEDIKAGDFNYCILHHIAIGIVMGIQGYGKEQLRSNVGISPSETT